jgi:hypothetical protein
MKKTIAVLAITLAALTWAAPAHADAGDRLQVKSFVKGSLMDLPPSARTNLCKLWNTNGHQFGLSNQPRFQTITTSQLSPSLVRQYGVSKSDANWGVHAAFDSVCRTHR